MRRSSSVFSIIADLDNCAANDENTENREIPRFG